MVKMNNKQHKKGLSQKATTPLDHQQTPGGIGGSKIRNLNRRTAAPIEIADMRSISWPPMP